MCKEARMSSHQVEKFRKDLLAAQGALTLVELGEIVKADKRQKPASGSRVALGTLFPVSHGLVAGRKGRKFHAAASEGVGSAVGSEAGGIGGTLIGQGAGVGTVLGSGLGSMVGARIGTRRAQRKGYYKPEAD
jgi:hypothetical protein